MTPMDTPKPTSKPNKLPLARTLQLHTAMLSIKPELPDLTPRLATEKLAKLVDFKITRKNVLHIAKQIGVELKPGRKKRDPNSPSDSRTRRIHELQRKVALLEQQLASVQRLLSDHELHLVRTRTRVEKLEKDLGVAQAVDATLFPAL